METELIKAGFILGAAATFILINFTGGKAVNLITKILKLK